MKSLKLRNVLRSNIYMYYLYRLYLICFVSINQVKSISSLKMLRSALKMIKLKNKYKGKRCFIIGNGPSLNKMNLNLLKNQYTFGLNRIYLLFPKLGFSTTFHVSTNKLLIDQCSDEFNALENITKFYPAQYSNNILDDDQTIFYSINNNEQFTQDFTEGLWEGSTVTYVAMQIAYFLGFKDVILIGVDHNFATKGSSHKILQMNTDDKNHFSAEYFKGLKWQLPDLKTSEFAYKLAKIYFENNGRQIRDATVNGKLNVFQKVDYESIFK